MIINKSQAIFRLELQKAPGHPIGDRLFVRPLPVEQMTEGGLEKPQTAQTRTFSGIVLAVGDQAADRLYDLGVEIGDEVGYARYAGVIEEWQHIIKPGEDKTCLHDGRWDFLGRDNAAWKLVKAPDIDMQLRCCAMCGALKLAERVHMLAGEDPLFSIDLEARLESGEFKRVRGQTADGKTRYYIERPAGRKDSFEIGKE